MGIFFCFFAIFYSFFRKNDEKLTCVFGVRAYLIDFLFGGFYLYLAVVIPTPTSSLGDPFSPELLLGFYGLDVISLRAGSMADSSNLFY